MLPGGTSGKGGGQGFGFGGGGTGRGGKGDSSVVMDSGKVAPYDFLVADEELSEEEVKQVRGVGEGLGFRFWGAGTGTCGRFGEGLMMWGGGVE